MRLLKTSLIAILVMLVSTSFVWAQNVLIEDFEGSVNVVRAKYVGEDTPIGGWREFSADTVYVTDETSRSGSHAMKLVKPGTGWGCGVQYALEQTVDFTGKQISLWVKVDTVMFTTVIVNVFDAADGEQWEQIAKTNLIQGQWQQLVANISPEYFVDWGNGGVGDKNLDITQITKFNIIFHNNGEDFLRNIYVDDVTIGTVFEAEQDIETFEIDPIIVRSKDVGENTPAGGWREFSSDTVYATDEEAHCGDYSLKLMKSGTGWGCGVQYALTEAADWTGKQVSFWVKIDTVAFTTVILNVFDAIDGEQWEQIAKVNLVQGAWNQVVVNIAPEYFVDWGNGGVGDKNLDVTQITKFNLIIHNNGEDFARQICFDDVQVGAYVEPTAPYEQESGMLDGFEKNPVVVRSKYVGEDTPVGGWREFSADTVYVTDETAHSGSHSLKLIKSGTGWGCGVQYLLEETSDWTGQQVSFWVKADTTMFTTAILNVFDAVDVEQWEQIAKTNLITGVWQQVVVNISPEYFVDWGNGGVGDKNLDVSQIEKINIIIHNNGEDFLRNIYIDDVTVGAAFVPAVDIDGFEGTSTVVRSKYIGEVTPIGGWREFSADTICVTNEDAHTGTRSLKIDKSGVGWGCGVQYALESVSDWSDNQVSLWVKIDSVAFTTVVFNVFDAVDGEQWEQIAANNLIQGVWQQIVVNIAPEYFVDNGNGGTGDGNLDVTQIEKFNIIILNNGEDFKRSIYIDDVQLGKQATITQVGDKISSFLPSDYRLEQNYPNPFNPSTTISYTIPKSGLVELAIYNLLGQRIKVLVNQNMPVGTHTVQWKGTNENGLPVASGVYIYRISTNEFNQTSKLMLLR